MLRTIQEVQPRWVVGENVLGLTNWNGGLVFNEVQVDLEAKGYEVQAFILLACAKNAPHRRDRVWFVAYSNLHDDKRKIGNINAKEKRISKEYRKEYSPSREFSGTNIQDVTNTNKIGFSTKMGNGELGGELGFTKRDEQNMWNSFPTQPPICGGDDGLPTELDSISISKYRKESLMAYGNAIVPQVAYEIFKAINEFELMVTAQVTDKDYYNELVKNEQIGFSIEGFLGLKLSNQLNNKPTLFLIGDEPCGGYIAL